MVKHVIIMGHKLTRHYRSVAEVQATTGSSDNDHNTIVKRLMTSSNSES